MPDRFTDNSDEESGRDDTALEGTDGTWWDGFFADRSKGIPFFARQPDENLAEWFASGLLVPGRVLELGCGNGRNAVHLARLGCTVDAVDFSDQAVSWARERASQAGVQVAFQCCSVFDAQFAAGSYDLVYDSGCFHHLPPRRRQDYVGLVARALRPGGRYGLVCFRPEGGSGYTDEQVYQRGSLGGGLGYSEQALRSLWDTPPFSVPVLRQMKQAGRDEPWFGLDFLWTLLATRQGES
ncbi:MAG TPA: class I SAM-dependent methyltransferase [Trebonia sp.]